MLQAADINRTISHHENRLTPALMGLGDVLGVQLIEASGRAFILPNRYCDFQEVWNI